MARKRPAPLDVVPLTEPTPGLALPVLPAAPTAPAPPAALTCAEAHALRRSAPLTPDQFAALRRRAELGISPLHRR